MSFSHCKKISEAVWEIPPSFKSGMNVAARMFATEKLLQAMEEGVFQQIANVATLPGIVEYACCMPDGHFGYGFPIGGTAAFDINSGIISPGGIGFDINCGMRLIRTSLTLEEVRPNLETLIDKLFTRIPAGLGGTSSIKLNENDFLEIAERGMEWCLDNGYAERWDLQVTEENGRMKGADASVVSKKAIERGIHQVGTLGSGNHYLEIQVIRPEHVFDEQKAKVMGLDLPNQIVIMVHCGSRGFGHQIATDYLQKFSTVFKKERESLPDRELAYAPFQSKEGQEYFAAMQCAVNMAFANRQMITHRIRDVFSEVFHKSPEELGIEQVYDITHNTAKTETHEIQGSKRKLIIHRKGATRAFAPGMEGIPAKYKKIGQPVIIGGSMETGSYVLTGTESGAASFYTTAHGSGRLMGRRQAKRTFQGDDIRRSMEQRGMYIRAVSKSSLAEEAGGAYKDIDSVIQSATLSGLSKQVAKCIPIGNIKG